ncbi:MAG: EAL domain-containing protein [Aeromicrobium sp.]|nr:EAL domain-containing protein [Burkholderiales bacterium]
MKKSILQEFARLTIDTRELLRTLRNSLKNWRIYGPWLVAGLLIWGTSWGVLLTALESDRRKAKSDGIAEAATLSRVYAGQVARTMDALDQTLLHVRYEWALANGALKLDTMAEEGLFPPVTTSYLAITDREGNVRTSTLPATGKLNLKDRPYFVVQMAATDDNLFVDKPTIGRVSKRRVFQFSRRLLDLNGDFDGVVVISLTPAYFTEHFDVATFGKHGYLGVVGEDNVIRTSRIGQIVLDESGQVWTETPQFSAPGGSAWFEGGRWFSDKRNRIVGWQKVPGYPLIAVTGLDEEVILASYWTARANTMRRALLTTLGFAVVVLGGMAFSLRLAWRKNQLDLIQTTYRMATEGSSEGFFILGALINPSGVIDDFEVVDCNQKGAEFCRQRREAIIGRRFSSLYREDTHERIMVALQQAAVDGAFEGELEFHRGDADSSRWIHMRALRSDSKLAITLRDISDTKAHVEELEYRGNHDALTGLPNRHWLQWYLPKAIEYAKENNSGIALLFVDLDGFKFVNDTMGHAAGDEILRHSAHRLQEAVRPHDNVVRIGGDEFVVILENNVLVADAGQVAARVLAAFKPKFKLMKGAHSIGASIGIGVFPRDGVDAATLLQNADMAMYSVKTSGKGDYRFYDLKFFDELRVRLEREAELRRAVENDEFIMYYQLRVDFLTNVATSFEALVRWEHPSRGLVEPREFIPLAEETGLILKLGEIVIDKVCSQLALWSKLGEVILPVSVNVSSRQFNETDISNIFSSAISRYQIDPKLLEIELTESSMMGSSPNITNSLAAIRKLGIKLLIDDFGTGYSSLAQLQLLDFDILKIDQAFTSRLDDNEQARVLFTAIITMAHALTMRVVAEGVENARQVDILRSLGCDEMQGFYISVPMPATDRQRYVT